MSRHGPNAFSLLELVLVLVIISLALAVVTPSLGGWSRGMKLRTASDELLAATRLAHDRAATEAAPHTLVALDEGAGWAIERVDLAGQEGPRLHAGHRVREYVLPPGWSFAIESPSGESLEEIAFHPDGRGDVALLQLTSDRGEVATFARESIASGFRPQSEVRP